MYEVTIGIMHIARTTVFTIYIYVARGKHVMIIYV
mgnify:CR=1 FL=1